MIFAILTGSSVDGSRKSSRVTFAPNLINAPRKGSRKESSQSLKLTSVLSHNDRRKTSSKSEGAAANDSRKVSFIDELTGQSARADPKFEQQLQLQLKIVKNKGELGEFMQNQKSNPVTIPTTTIPFTTIPISNESASEPPIASDEEKEAKIRNLK